ncbi:MAG: cell wall-active antibiotics response protein LiaF [Bacillota bacterium]|nr:cell wall-active antibiotics response protein LiaF [Bacillota bacterium]MDP4169617.1 cell wall-active antibiotics response protein LiaF [Bacillota bacterium]
MLKSLKKDYPSWIVIIGIFVLLMEIAFFNSGLIFSLFISAMMIYLGRKRMAKKKGKILFWGGIIFTCTSIFTMMTFKFLLVAILIHFIVQFSQSKRTPKKITPLINQKESVNQAETIIRTKPLLENILVGQQKTPSHAYEWNDINIQAGVGDTIIDFSNTFLPKGETIVFVRNFIGNVRILVPYDVEVSLHHSVMAGSTSIFGLQETKLFNQVYHLQTPNYEQSGQKIKIFTSLIVGNLEVVRI